jgi:hypothetical protein
VSNGCVATGLPNWSNCNWDGSVCQSGICGCNGGPPPPVCLPNSNYPVYCSSGSPNWWPCLDDSQCVSNWCGCNGGPGPPKCLPSTAYPKTCV